MVPPQTDRQTSLSESPWFWAYAFLAAAVAALLIAAPKYGERQTQLERQFLARQQGGQAVVGREGPVAPSRRDRLIIPLRPLLVGFAGLLLVAWACSGWQRIRHASRLPSRESTRHVDP
jgi:hypothetical protein